MSATFLGMAQDLMADADAKAAFAEDPGGFLVARGFDGLSPEDLADAVGFVAETVPAETARALTDPETDGDVLARLAQVEPAAVEEPSGDGDTDPEVDDPDLDDVDDVAEADPTLLLADPDAGFELFDEGAAEAGLGVGFGNEDVDDVSPPDHGGPPDLDLHL